MDINQISELIKQKQEEIQKLKSEIWELRQEKAEKEYGVKCGDKVINKEGEVGVLDHYDGAFWMWRKLKKNGEPSKGITTCYDKQIAKVD